MHQEDSNLTNKGNVRSRMYLILRQNATLNVYTVRFLYHHFIAQVLVHCLNVRK